LDGIVEITVFAVGSGDLPPDSHALLGNKHLRELRVSLDFAQNHPDGSLVDAIAFGRSLVFASTLCVTTPPCLDSSVNLNLRWWFCGVCVSSFGFTLILATEAQQAPTIELRVLALCLVVPVIAFLSRWLPEPGLTLLSPLVRPSVWARIVTASALAPDTRLLMRAPEILATERPCLDFASERFANVLAYNLTPQLGLGGISPYKAFYGRAPHPVLAYRDYSYPPRTTRRVSTFAPTSPVPKRPYSSKSRFSARPPVVLGKPEAFALKHRSKGFADRHSTLEGWKIPTQKGFQR
jgi:hypothetical protein